MEPWPPSDFAIRAAAAPDEAAVTAVLAASYPVLLRPDYEAAALRAALPGMMRANPILLRSGTYHLAEADQGLVVGCGGWTRERPGSGEVEPGLGHVRHFATHPDWLGRGIGRSLYRVCEDQARAAGMTRLECYSSLNAEGFYAALGFARVRQTQLVMGDGLTLPSILMRRVI